MSIIKRIGLPFQLLIALVLAIIFGKFVSVADSFYNFWGPPSSTRSLWLFCH